MLSEASSTGKPISFLSEQTGMVRQPLFLIKPTLQSSAYLSYFVVYTNGPRVRQT
jgi:hypothetical protein